MRAYDEKYLEFAMKNLGEVFDYAINCCGIKPNEFEDLFKASKIVEYFGKGNPKYVVGKSGTELVIEIISESNLNINLPTPQIDYDYSREYWAGWILAYYQWYSGKSFKNILNEVSIQDILKLYPTLHEASEDKFIDTIENIIANRKTVTKLQRLRKTYGYSQRELAEKTGVNIRTLQQYELGTKDLSKASVSTVLALASVLGCKIEDII